tara:strand:- start:85 stop:549 length:465 start_codon:yes stop_codon:yes gene_type:complete
MAYQKLNASKAWKVYPSDDAPIPQVMVQDGSGTATAQTATTVTDNTVDFLKLGVKRGMILVNTTTNASTIITGIVGDTLTVNANVFVVGNAYQIYGGQNNGAVLYVGTTGNIRVLTAANDDVVFVGVPAGQFIPVNVIKVFASGTTADDILALW